MHQEIRVLHIPPPPAPVMRKMPLNNKLQTHTRVAFSPTLTLPSLGLTPAQIAPTYDSTTVQLLLPKAPRAMSILPQKGGRAEGNGQKKDSACPIRHRLGEDAGTRCCVALSLQTPLTSLGDLQEPQVAT